MEKPRVQGWMQPNATRAICPGWDKPWAGVKRLSFKTHFCLLMSMFLVKQFNCLGLSFLICKTGKVSIHVGWWCENYSRCYGILIPTTV